MFVLIISDYEGKLNLEGMVSVMIDNIFARESSSESIELTDVLLRAVALNGGLDLRIERIVSNGKASPSDFWYDQDFNEWCCLVCGHAVLQTEAQDHVSLVKGDVFYFPRHLRHRVDTVSEDAVWLAVCWQ